MNGFTQMTHQLIKNVATRVLPSNLLQLARSTSRSFHNWKRERKIRLLYESHLQRNSNLKEDEIRLRNGLVLKVTPFAREMYEYFCFRDPEIVSEFDGYAKLSTAKKRLLDIGAEHGFFAIAFASSPDLDRNVLAIEPSPIAFPVMEEQILRNGLTNVAALNIAVGDKDGEIEMAVRGNHVVAAIDFYKQDLLDCVRVPVRTVDDVCFESGFEPDLVKIDVEGYELFVLIGAQRILERCSPTIMLEIHPELIKSLGQSTQQLIDFLENLGYHQFDPNTGTRTRLVVPNGAGAVRVAFQKGNATA